MTKLTNWREVRDLLNTITDDNILDSPIHWEKGESGGNTVVSVTKADWYLDEEGYQEAEGWDEEISGPLPEKPAIYAGTPFIDLETSSFPGVPSKDEQTNADRARNG
ncbi:hypothetical protein [Spirosoma sordidisoli]|uniref:Uncharacterized protein n=1 Tax=Spirosoma sordidisoli TaxID=2502893 RepID=A0A4Q2UK44_9BACT|nr:hypothetical protein [Spirosoma sordidisoli]RYC69644.1 hypothetical protein EQG79_13670 [Spirosoma sordidisoli]